MLVLVDKLHTNYPYGLHEREQSSNLEKPTDKPFMVFPRFSNRREVLEKVRVKVPTKFDTTIPY